MKPIPVIEGMLTLSDGTVVIMNRFQAVFINLTTCWSVSLNKLDGLLKQEIERRRAVGS